MYSYDRKYIDAIEPAIQRGITDKSDGVFSAGFADDCNKELYKHIHEEQGAQNGLYSGEHTAYNVIDGNSGG
jgi:hypothetical protein